MSQTIIYEDAERQVVLESSDTKPKGTPGYWESTRTVWKAGSAGANRQSIEDQLDQAIAYFSGNYRNWASLSAAQKDTAAKNGQRALANLARLIRDQFADAD